jgi:protease I
VGTETVDMSAKLSNKKIAILSAEGFEESELTKPKKALEDAGAKVSVVSLKPGEIQGMKHAEKGVKVKVDLTVSEANPSDFDGLLLPGGLMNPDALRMDQKALNFVRAFFHAGKPVAAICHGPQVLISADLLHGRTITSWPAIAQDVRNAGAHWVDEEVHVDNGLVTSRKPDDIPAFNKKMIEEFAEGVHAKQRELAAH